jgi:phosphinothricin acetyltransferase
VAELVRVRPATRDDADAIRGIYAPVVVDSAVSFEETPPDADEIARRMLAQPRLPWLVATRGNELVGYAYASMHRARRGYRWSAECSVYLHEQEQGRGTARRLYQDLFTELTALGYVSVFAGIALPNDRSVRLHQALGFEAIGTFRHVGFTLGRWHDVGWWQLALTQPPHAPAEPRPWDP